MVALSKKQHTKQPTRFTTGPMMLTTDTNPSLAAPMSFSYTTRPRTSTPPTTRTSRFASVTVAITEQLQRSTVPPPPPPPAPKLVDTKPASDVLAGALARAVSQSTIHPLDTLKVRLQTNTKVPGIPSSSGGNMLTTIGKMYRGVLGAASGAGVAVGAYFLVYGAANNAIARWAHDLPAGMRAFVAGAIAAAGSSVVKVPIAVCIRSVQAGVYPNAVTAARSIVRSAGPRGLFTGYLPTLLEDVPDMAVKFAVYETLQNTYVQVFGRPANSTEDFVMGAVSGAMAAAATTPIDVIKTNMMCSAASRPSLRAAVRGMAGKPMSAVFRGVGPRALSSGVNSAVFFCFFEALRAHFVRVKAVETKV